MKQRFLAAIAAFFLSAVVQAHPLDGTSVQVVAVLDGDTVSVLTNARQEIRCRLAGIDAPEKSQPYGQVSKRHLSDLVYGKVVILTIQGQDRYGRSICWLKLPNGLLANFLQVEAGMAWVYRAYFSSPAFIAAEDNARAARRGLWAGSVAPVPPWEYRHKQ